MLDDLTNRYTGHWWRIYTELLQIPEALIDGRYHPNIPSPCCGAMGGFMATPSERGITCHCNNCGGPKGTGGMLPSRALAAKVLGVSRDEALRKIDAFLGFDPEQRQRGPLPIAEAIADVDSDWQLIPVGPSKRPVDPATGRNLTDWTHTTYDVDGIIALAERSPYVKAVGVVLGPPSGIIAVDFDGNGSEDTFAEVFGRPWTDLPITVSWSSGRPNRKQLAFRVPFDAWEHLRGRRFWQSSDGRTVLELRGAGHQSVVCGQHPDTAGYVWLNSPADHRVADAPDWLLEPLYKAPHEPISADYRPATSDDVARALEVLKHIKPRDAYDPWIRVGMALHSVDDGLLSDWVNWSRGCSNFDEGECLAKWQSFKGSGVTIGSLYFLAKQDGWQPKSQQQAAATGRITLPDGQPSTNGNGQRQQQGQQSPDEDEDEPAYLELLEAVLQAIEARDINAEMQWRAALGQRFRRNDDQVNAALFDRLRLRRVQPVSSTTESVDLTTLDSLQYLLDGWIIRNQLHLTYGPAGTGKTTLCLAKALAVCRGTGLLDRSNPAPAGKVLYIATDSGPEALRKALDDLDAADDPMLKPGPDQRLFIWADAPEQGQVAWCSDITGMVRLVSFVERHQISYVIIDSAKAVTSRANVSYLSNESTATLLTFMAEVLCRSLGCAIDIISHDGTAAGSHSGAKAWSEIPSMVVALQPIVEDDKRQGTMARFIKDRAAVIDPGRRVRFDLDREAAELILLPGQEVVGNAEEAILTVLADAHANDVESLKRKALIDEVFHRFRRSASTVDNTIPDLLRRRLIVRPRRGYFALSPAQSQMRHEMREEASIEPPYKPLPPTPGRNTPKSTANTGILELPDGFGPGNPSGNSEDHPLERDCPVGNSSEGIGQSQTPVPDWQVGQSVPTNGDIPPPGAGSVEPSGAAAVPPADGAASETDADDDWYDEFAD